MFKKTLFFICLLFPCISFAHELPDYNSVENALEKGNRISIFLDFSKCIPSLPMKAYYTPNTAMLVNNTVLFSDYHLTFNNPQFPNEATGENVSYQFNDSGNFSIQSVLLNPATYEKKGTQPPVINCKISEGVTFFSVH